MHTITLPSEYQLGIWYSRPQVLQYQQHTNPKIDLDYDTITMPAQYHYNTKKLLTVSFRYHWSTITVPRKYLRYHCSTISVPMQYHFGTNAVPSRYQCSTSPVTMQYQKSTVLSSTKYCGTYLPAVPSFFTSTMDFPLYLSLPLS